ncbi:MAG: YicC/YloC family endoribonuclease [Bacillota bacterium]
MVKSMTGYGRGESQSLNYSLVVEAKAVNHRFLEVVIRSPRQLNQLDDMMRKIVQGALGRGRIDLFITLEESLEKKSQLKVDKELALAYYNSLLTVGQICQIATEPDLRTIATYSGVISQQQEEDDLDELSQLAQKALNQALESLIKMRESEGAVLAQDVLKHSQKIAELVAQIAEYRQVVVKEHQAKLQMRIADLLSDIEIDQTKLAEEVAFFADKSDISEELARLESHHKQFISTVESSDQCGRKLEFILQEMNREINTIGSKSNHIGISTLVIEVKSGLEKIREQIQNME